MTRENSYATLDADGQVPLGQLDHALGGGPHTHDATDIDAGTIDDARIPAGVTRDSEVTTAVSDHSADTTNVHGILDTSLLLGGPHDHDADYDAIGAAAAAAAASQPLDSDLTAIAALTTTAFGRALLELADAAALGAAHTHSGASTLYAPGTFTTATGNYTIMADLLSLTGVEVATMEGTAVLALI